MRFSEDWDRIYRDNQQLARWPFTDLVSFVMRYCSPRDRTLRVLELGFGAGANIPFFLSFGRRVEYSGIEGSSNIVERALEEFPALAGRLACGDFTASLPFPGPFDLVVDRSAMTHNATSDIRCGLALVRERLAPGGTLIGIDWFSTRHDEFKKGIAGEDRYSRSGFASGQFAGVGSVHFFDERHLRRVLAGLTVTVMEHKVVTRHAPPGQGRLAFWNFAAKRD